MEKFQKILILSRGSSDSDALAKTNYAVLNVGIFIKKIWAISPAAQNILSSVADRAFLALKSTKWRFSKLNHQNFGFFGLVHNSPTHTGLICVKIPEPNISCLRSFNCLRKVLKVLLAAFLCFLVGSAVISEVFSGSGSDSAKAMLRSGPSRLERTTER